MKKSMVLTGIFLAAVWAYGQDEKQQSSQSDLGATTESMSHGHHHGMGPHMFMTTLRDPRPGDPAKAQTVVDQARPALERYKDYKLALADGFKIFLPDIPQPMYHFTNWTYAMGAAFRFDPTRPTSLLYEKHGDDYKLIGAMYTAPVRFTQEQLNDRIPLSVAQWHQHVNMCRPPKAARRRCSPGHPSSVWPAPYPPKKNAKPPVERLRPTSLAGWSTCIPGRNLPTRSGP